MTENETCGYEDTTTGHPCQHPKGSCPVPSHSGDPIPNGGNPQGRPPFIDNDRDVQRALEAAESGMYLTHIAAYARISYRTLKRTLDRGEEHAENDTDSKYSHFWHEFNAREAEGIKKRLDEVSPEHFVATKGYAKTERREVDMDATHEGGLRIFTESPGEDILEELKEWQ